MPGAHDAQSPQIAVDRNGNVTVLWERYAGTKIVLQSVDRPSGGCWTEPVDIGEMNLGADPEPGSPSIGKATRWRSGSRAK